MTVGCIREIKKHEYRVGMSPHCVAAYVGHGHKVIVESKAGDGAGFSDGEYEKAGAKIENDKARIFAASDMIVKVKEVQPEEYNLLREDQILFTYLHLAADRPQTMALLERKVKAVAYETIRLNDGTLPCLKPMSEIAGRMSIQEGARCLERPFGGRGVLLGGVPGVRRGRIGILGGGVVGMNAAKMAVGIGAEVSIIDLSSSRLAYIDDVFGGNVTTLYSNEQNIQLVLEQSDLVVGAVLIPGARAPRLIRREHLGLMKKGSVIVDVAVDQGGCAETTKPTSHDDPTFIVDGVIHYCVANMPGAVSVTSTLALTSTTLRYGLELADLGVEEACRRSAELRSGLNVYRGHLTYPDVAKAFDLPYSPASDIG